ncbi:MAG: phage tail protein [Desulfobacterales bacterium]|nr:phage tail protein [Desulfobacterales bacterium]
MSEPFIAEIRIFPYNFAPRGWAYCDGQMLPISQNTSLFSLIGTTYGGDGRTNMALPNLKDRAAMHPGRGPGLSHRNLGQAGGSAVHTLTADQMPAHTHSVTATKNNPTSADPKDLYFSKHRDPGKGFAYSENQALNVKMSPQAVSRTGASQAHQNMQPYLGVAFFIALVGLYPQRN